MIYLAKNGKAVAFTEEQYEAMKENGGIETYRWIWNPSAHQWNALDPAPLEAPTTEERVEAPVVRLRPVPAPAPVEESPIRARQFVSELEGVCHDQHHLISGRIHDLNDRGCDLISDSPTPPPFTRRSRLYLNVFDPKSGRSENVRAQVVQVVRQQGAWTYRLSWDQCPELALA